MRNLKEEFTNKEEARYVGEEVVKGHKDKERWGSSVYVVRYLKSTFCP